MASGRSTSTGTSRFMGRGLLGLLLFVLFVVVVVNASDSTTTDPGSISSSSLSISGTAALTEAELALQLDGGADNDNDAAAVEEGHNNTINNNNNNNNNSSSTSNAHIHYDDDNDHYDGGFFFQELTYAQSLMTAYLPKAFSLLSILCSFAITREVLVDHQNRIGGPISRLIFSRSIYDGFFSVGMFIGTWAIPNDSYYDVPGQFGTQASCTFQGFIIQLGFVGSLFANVILSLYYMCAVYYGWSDRDLQLYEWYMQGLISILALTSAIYPIPMKLYNPANQACWIGSDPPFCNGEEDCVRGSNPTNHYLFFGFLPMICLLISVWIMVRLFNKVREIENKTKKYATASNTMTMQPPPSRCYSFDGSDDGMMMRSNDKMGVVVVATTTTGGGGVSDDGMMAQGRGGGGGSDDGLNSTDQLYTNGGSNDEGRRKRPTTHSAVPKPRVSRRKSIAVAKQGAFYVIAFSMTHFFSLLLFIVYLAWGVGSVALNIIVFSMLTPSAGTFDFIVFARTRDMKTPEGKILRKLFFCGRRVPMGSKSMRQSTQRGSHQERRRRRPSSAMRYSGNNARLSGSGSSNLNKSCLQSGSNPQQQHQQQQQQVCLPTPPPKGSVSFQDDEDVQQQQQQQPQESAASVVESGEASFVS